MKSELRWWKQKSTDTRAHAYHTHAHCVYEFKDKETCTVSTVKTRKYSKFYFSK